MSLCAYLLLWPGGSGQQENVTAPTHRNISDEKERMKSVGQKNAARMSGARFGERKEVGKISCFPFKLLTGECTDQKSLSTLGEHGTFADRIIRISPTKPLLKHG
jgi:hypothetical protein